MDRHLEINVSVARYKMGMTRMNNLTLLGPVADTCRFTGMKSRFSSFVSSPTKTVDGGWNGTLFLEYCNRNDADGLEILDIR